MDDGELARGSKQSSSLSFTLPILKNWSAEVISMKFKRGPQDLEGRGQPRDVKIVGKTLIRTGKTGPAAAISRRDLAVA